MKRDLQRTLVYRWESSHIAPYDQNPVPFNQIKPIVDFVWQSQGLQFPPQVIPLPKYAKIHADATRTTLRFKQQTFTWTILHELAHAMTTQCNDQTNRHGSLFMGVYCQLAAKYLNLNLQQLLTSAQQIGLHVKPNAQPVWL